LVTLRRSSIDAPTHVLVMARLRRQGDVARGGKAEHRAWARQQGFHIRVAISGSRDGSL
jgi:hypothetical protein